MSSVSPSAGGKTESGFTTASLIDESSLRRLSSVSATTCLSWGVRSDRILLTLVFLEDGADLSPLLEFILLAEDFDLVAGEVYDLMDGCDGVRQRPDLGDFLGVFIDDFFADFLGDFPLACLSLMNLSLPDGPGWGSVRADGKVGAVDVAAGSKESSTVVIGLLSPGRFPAIIVEDVSDGGIGAVEVPDTLAGAELGPGLGS